MSKLHPNSGEGNPRAKLQAWQVIAIRELHKDRTMSLREIGEMFNVSRKTVINVCNGQSWKKVEGI